MLPGLLAQKQRQSFADVVINLGKFMRRAAAWWSAGTTAAKMASP
jgi:hypothetical protein